MGVGSAVGQAALQGLTSLLPMSWSGHEVAARAWLEPETRAAILPVLGQLAAVAAMLVVVRGRLSAALRDGIRGIAKPALLHQSDGGRDAVAWLLALLAAGAVEHALLPFSRTFAAVPRLAGVGLLVTAAGLASTVLAPAPRHVCPTPVGALLAGVAHGVAVSPGGSQLAAAFVVLCWLGVSRWRAAELSMLVSAPLMALGTTRAWLGADLGTAGGAEAAMVLVVTFVAALLAASWWRALCERSRTALLALWLGPLAVALLAYDRALPPPRIPPPERAAAGLGPSGLPAARLHSPATATSMPGHGGLRGHHGRRRRHPLLAGVPQEATQAALAARRA